MNILNHNFDARDITVRYLTLKDTKCADDIVKNKKTVFPPFHYDGPRRKLKLVNGIVELTQEPEIERKVKLMKNKSYWFITVFEKIPNENEPFNIGASRCWGFYTDCNKALEALHNNITDLHENCYNYAVLEEYYEGILSISGKRQFFVFDKNKNGYIEIDEPKRFLIWSGFAMG